MPAENDRETGARKAQKREASDRDQSQGDAAENKPSNEAQGPSQTRSTKTIHLRAPGSRGQRQVGRLRSSPALVRR